MDKNTGIRGVDIKRIGIFEYDRPMDSFVKDLAVKFAESGYAVDLFFRNVEDSPKIADISELAGNEKIRFFDFSTRLTLKINLSRKFIRLRNILALLFSFKFDDKPEKIIDPKVLQRTKEIISLNKYECFIGIEKKGLIWAGLVSEIFHCPLIYYSLELYIEDHPQYDSFCHLREAEKKYHQLSIATIIQDKTRCEILCKANGLDSTNALYFPISVRGNIIEEKSDYLHNKFNIDIRKKIILYFGTLYKSRYIDKIVESAKDLDNDMVLVLHGYGVKIAKLMKHLQSIADKEKVFFSLDLVPENEITTVISSAHIGLALYRTTNPNDNHVAFSSAKMAYYTQCGIPVIAFETSSFTRLMNQYKCGELIHTIDEISQKVRLIMDNYDKYRRQSLLAFKEFYDYDKNFAGFLQCFEELLLTQYKE